MVNEYLIKKESLTKIADGVRELSGTSAAMNLNDIVSCLSDASEKINVSSEIIDRSIQSYSGNETVIGPYAFGGCPYLSQVSFPKASSIQSNAFYSCTALTEIGFPVATYIGSSAFFNTNIKEAAFPMVESMGEGAFNGCNELSMVSFPVLTSVPPRCFGTCGLETIDLPNASTIYTSGFTGCTFLSEVILSKVTFLQSYAFNNCYRFTNLYLTNPNSVCYLQDYTVFQNTPFDGYSKFYSEGRIHVPRHLLSAYQSATGWGRYSRYMVGFGESNLITFTVDGMYRYTATEGMTWEDWINSEYNTEGFVLSEDGILAPSQDMILVNTIDSAYVSKDEEIEDGGYYMWEPW